MPDFKSPLSKFKSLRKKKADTAQHASDLIDMSIIMSVAIKKLFFDKSEIKFTSDLIIKKNMITQFGNRMRVDGMEKFNQSTVFSVVNLFNGSKAAEANKPIGLVIVYIERKFVPEMLRLLHYPYIEYDDDQDVLDGTGTIANLIAGQFKKELRGQGYIDLEMGPFQSYINKIPNGVEFPINQTNRYEITFDIDEVKRLVVEMVMAPVPKS